jgi:hypothetical protein
MTPSMSGMWKSNCSYGGTDDFGQVAGSNGGFCNDPEANGYRAAIGGTTCLGEILFGSDAEFDGQALQQNRHQVGEHDDEQERVAVAGAGG